MSFFWFELFVNFGLRKNEAKKHDSHQEVHICLPKNYIYLIITNTATAVLDRNYSMSCQSKIPPSSFDHHNIIFSSTPLSQTSPVFPLISFLPPPPYQNLPPLFFYHFPLLSNPTLRMPRISRYPIHHDAHAPHTQKKNEVLPLPPGL